MWHSPDGFAHFGLDEVACNIITIVSMKSSTEGILFPNNSLNLWLSFAASIASCMEIRISSGEVLFCAAGGIRTHVRFSSQTDFECCKTLADSRLEQVVTGHLVKVLETQALQGVADIPTRIGQRRFEPPQSSNKTAFLRKKPPFLRVCKKSGKKTETPAASMKHPFGPKKRKGASS